jgi:predicted nucleotidyltransferase
MNFELVNRCLILKVVGGSRAYGTDTPESDIDYRGIVIPPDTYFMGLDKFEQSCGHGPDQEYDFEYRDIRKYVQLAMKGNPNVLEVIFTDEPNNVLLTTKWSEGLKTIRQEFITQRCIDPFLGYAGSQLNSLERKKFPAKGKNPKRAKLIRKYGFDTKFAMQLMRLLYTCWEMVTSGTLKVRRPKHEVNVLHDIREGRISKEYVIDVAKKYMSLIESLEGGSLKPEPDYNLVNTTVSEIVHDCLEERGW